MKKIGFDEIIVLSLIADKINLKMPQIDTVGGSKKDIDAQAQKIGIDFALQIFKKLHLVKEEISDLFKLVFDKKIESMSILEIKDNIIELFQDGGLKDFFK